MPCKSCGELEASCAAMRDALERMLIGAKHMSCAYKPEDPDPMWHCCDWSEVVEEIEQALSTTAGRERQERLEKLERVLKGYEQWEAALIMDNQAWNNELPCFTQELYDKWMELQRQRNAALDGDQNG